MDLKWKMSDFWNFFTSKFNIKKHYTKGEINISAGDYEMMIPVKKKNPTRVFLATEETGTPSCVGDVNWVSSQMVEDGFILYAKIKSNSCKVKYLVEHECNPYEESEIVIE